MGDARGSSASRLRGVGLWRVCRDLVLWVRMRRSLGWDMFGRRRLGQLELTRVRDSALVLGLQVGLCHFLAALLGMVPLLLWY